MYTALPDNYTMECVSITKMVAMYNAYII